MDLFSSAGLFALLIFVVGELIATLIFLLVTRTFGKGLKLDTLARGWLERLFIYVSLLYSLPQALILFGALKIGTRLKDNEDRISNDYFLVGNLLSVLIALIYYILSIELIGLS